jgi:hypothetical protein
MTDNNVSPISAPQAAPKSNWQRKLQLGVGIFMLAVFALIGVAKIVTWGDLPGCDSDGAKSGLSDIFKTAKLEFSRYIEIKTLTTTKEEITCNATLEKTAGGNAEFDYRIFFDGKDPKVQVTRAEDKI